MTTTNASENSTGRSRREALKVVGLVFLLLILLSILAGSIVLPNRVGRSAGAKVNLAKAQISTFGIALGTYERETGAYPTSRDGLQALRQKPQAVQNWRGPYIEKDVPLDPWGKPYVYEFPGKHNPSRYDLYATGPDGIVYGNWKQ